jgi:two-component system, OmpR family, response regulator TctD
MHALVVEDEARQRKALCDALSQWGFDATAADAGGTALQTWMDVQPDIVLLDLGLPDMDGLDVLQCARRQGLAAPVLLLTARTTIGDRILGLNLGADDYLLKPYDLGELLVRSLNGRTRRCQGTHCCVPSSLAATYWTRRWRWWRTGCARSLLLAASPS